MQLLRCIHNGAASFLDFSIAAGHREVCRGIGIEGEMWNTILSEELVNLLGLGRDDVREFGKPAPGGHDARMTREKRQLGLSAGFTNHPKQRVLQKGRELRKQRYLI